MLCMGSIGMDCVKSELCYKGTILQRNYGKMTFARKFSYDPFVKFYSKKFGSHNMVILYPNPFYNKVCYKGTAVYLYFAGYFFQVWGAIGAQRQGTHGQYTIAGETEVCRLS